MRAYLLTGLIVLALGVCLPALAANNPYGVHTFIHDQMSDGNITRHLDWALALTGPGGYVKQLMYPISPATTTINGQWVKFINACYSRGLIPVIRLGTWMEGGNWIKPTPDSPGVYTTWANTIKNVVSQMPRHDTIPLYIEVLNECNNNLEWSGSANPIEYARFFVQASNAIRSLGDSKIKTMNCGLSPGGSYDNVLFVQACCTVPGFIDAFDVWACHPYSSHPPELNRHDGTAQGYTIDSYLAELQVLANHGRTGVKIIATEAGYGLGADGEDARADRVMRAFRDYWSKWPEVLAICPYEFCDPLGGNDGLDWVSRSSGTTAGGLPTVAYEQYWSVYKLAKPGHTTGCISGKVTENLHSAPLSGAQIVLTPGSLTTTTDGAGNFFFPRLAPGVYSLSVSRTNYSDGSASGVAVAAEENVVRNFLLAPTTGCNITGTVLDSVGGQPIPIVQVTLSPGGHSTLTDSQGRFQFLGIAPSTYTLSAARYSYYPYTSPGMTLHAGDSRTFDFYLGPGSPPAGTSMIGGIGFEEPVGVGSAAGWVREAGSGSNFCVDETVRYSGRCSQRIDPGGPENDMVWGITNYSAVAGGLRYRVEIWCKTGSGIAGAAKLIGNWFTNDMIYKGSFYGAPELTTACGWTLLVARGVCPASGRLHVELRAETTAGSVWFDQLWCGYDGQAEDPLPSITNLITVPGTRSISFNWLNSTGAECTGTKIVYRTDRYPLTATDGAVAIDISAPPGNNITFKHQNLTYGQRYYYAFFAHSASGANLSRPQFATAVATDLTSPGTPVVTDGGAYSFSPDSLSASWSASDPDSGIANYRYRIGTSQGAGDIADWTDIGAVTSVTRSGLNLAPGTRCFFSVQAQNNAGLWSQTGYSDGIFVVKDCSGIAEAKGQPDGTLVRVSGVVVTSAGAFGSAAYAQEAGRSIGIRLEGNVSSLAEGQVVTVIGRTKTAGGERAIVVEG